MGGPIRTPPSGVHAIGQSLREDTGNQKKRSFDQAGPFVGQGKQNCSGTSSIPELLTKYQRIFAKQDDPLPLPNFKALKKPSKEPVEAAKEMHRHSTSNQSRAHEIKNSIKRRKGEMPGSDIGSNDAKGMWHVLRSTP